MGDSISKRLPKNPRGRTLLGWPEALVRLVHADDLEATYGEIRIPFDPKAGDDD